MQEIKSHQAHARARGPRRRIFTGAVAVVGSAGLAAAVLLPSGTALAAYQLRDQGPSNTTGSTTGEVDVTTAIALTDLTTTVLLTGAPGDTVTTAPATLTGGPGGIPTTASDVAFDVMTNNATGYNVTVAPATTDFGYNPVTVDTVTTYTAESLFPATALTVEETPGVHGAGTNTVATGFLALIDPTHPVTVYDQTVPSVAAAAGRTSTTFVSGDGDALSNEYSLTIPNAPGHAYFLVLNYVATTNI